MILYCPDLPVDLISKLPAGRINYVNKPQNISAIGAQADLAITPGGHSTVAQLLYSGVPQYIIPRYQEQLLLGLRIHQKGYGLVGYQDQADYSDDIKSLLGGTSFKNCALQFKDRNPHKTNKDLISRFSQSLITG